MSDSKRSRSCRRGSSCLAPELTGLQFLVVSLLFDGEMTSNELREGLIRRGYVRSRSAFSRLMGRLLKASIVSCFYAKEWAEEQKGKNLAGSYAEVGESEARDYAERQYIFQVSNLGVILWKEARDFYLSFGPPPKDLDAIEVSEAKYAEYCPKKRKEMVVEEEVERVRKMFEMARGL